MVFSKYLDNLTGLEREFREWANSANISWFIRFIRKFVVFALRIFRL
jgi:hypothetical protein